MSKLASRRASRNTPAPRLRTLVRDESGAALVEFGLIAPMLLVLLFGALDVGHTLYVQSVMQGAVQKAARDASLQEASGTSAVTRDAIDAAVKSQLLPLNGDAVFTFKRRFYRSFTDAAAAKKEDYVDTDSNGTCDKGEKYTDANNNNTWDVDGGDAVANAGARDNVVYTVTMEYPHMFPIQMFIGGPDKVTVRTSTVMANQPYGEQAKYAPPGPPKNCPL